MQCQKRLVGRNNMLARADRGLGCLFRRALRAAHEFNEDIHVIAAGQGDGIILPGITRQTHAPVLVL